VGLMYQDKSRELFIELDDQYNIIDISNNCYSILAFKKHEMIGSNFIQFTVNFHQNLLHTKRILEIQLQGGKGYIQTFDAFVFPNAIGGVSMSLFDITKYKQIEESENLFRMMLENANDIVYMYQIFPERKFIYINRAMERETGFPLSDFYNDPDLPLKNIHPEDLDVLHAKITGDADYKKPFQARFKNKDNQYLWLEEQVSPIFNENGLLEKIIVFCRNISERKAMEERLKKLCYYDSLTNLFNRNYYEKLVERFNTMDDRSIGIIVCDLDNLKFINDSLGHTYGDKLLVQMGNLLKNSLHLETVIRLGGDEFVIVIENTTECHVKSIFSKIRKAIDKYNQHHSELPIESSMGWSFSPHSKGRMKKIFKAADQMMYKEKNKKKIHEH